jgi:hypothetical protein
MYAAFTENERRAIEARLFTGQVPGPEAIARFIASLVESGDTLLDGCVVTLDNGYLLGMV